MPHEIGQGASWDPSSPTPPGDAVRQQLVAVGTTWDFAPVQDLARDNRWGRYYETVVGGQAAGRHAGRRQHHRHAERARRTSSTSASTVKHFAAYGSSVNGHDRVQAEIPIRYLQDEFLPSYAAAIDAGAATVMTQDGSINHIPAYASHVPADHRAPPAAGLPGRAHQRLREHPGSWSATTTRPSNLAEAAAQAINAGVDVSMTPSDYQGFTEGVLTAVHNGWISRARIDQSVRRILTLKFRLGLFDHPYVDAGQGRRGGHREQGPRAARLAGVDRPAAQPEQRAAAVAEHRQDRRHRARAPTT